MHWIETKGSWGQIGQQYGEAFREQLHWALNRYCPWLVAEPAKYVPILARLRLLAQEHCPDLIEETQGMAQAAGLDGEMLWGLRLFTDVRALTIDPGCTVVFLAQSAQGPLLGRNCDIEAESHPVQICQTIRPNVGPARVSLSYVGLVAGVGINEHGLGVGGASAHTPAVYGTQGLTGGLLFRTLLGRCGSVAQGLEFVGRQPFLGKPCNILLADSSAASVVLEMAPGRTPLVIPRRAPRSWQCTTNFFASGQTPVSAEPDYLQSAYARYGRVCHQLADELAPATLDGLKQLLAEVAQPGLCQPAKPHLPTAFTHISELAQRRIHVSEGPPGSPYRVIQL